MEIDHVFCFVTPDLPEARELAAAGFAIAPRVVHAGQGTANRCVLFECGYLELIFLADADEARHNPVRLDRRARWRQTGACPFGVALRGAPSQAERARCWPYHPPYAPRGTVIWIHRRSHEAEHLPLVFVVEPPGDPAPGAPARRGFDPRLLRHRCGATGISGVRVVGPLSETLSLPGGVPVGLEEAAVPHLHLYLDGVEERRIEAGELLTLSVAPPRRAPQSMGP